MKALDRSVETLGLWIVTSSVTFIKSINQSSIKLRQMGLFGKTFGAGIFTELFRYKEGRFSLKFDTQIHNNFSESLGEGWEGKREGGGEQENCIPLVNVRKGNIKA